MPSVSERRARKGRGDGPASWAVAALLGGALALFVHTGPFWPRRLPRATVADVKDLVRDRYVKEVDDRTLEYGALRGIASVLDPYSSFIPPVEASEFRDDTDGALSGVGIEITIEKGYLTVIAPLEDSPAWEARILPGDRIIEIDGKVHEVASVEEAARLIKGPPGTKVRLTVVHEGGTKAEEVELVRRRLAVPSVKRPRIVDAARGIGYVRIAQFGLRTDVELAAAVRSLLGRGAKALVIDLRSNPGGHLDAALGVSDLFVDSGVILRTISREPGESRDYAASPPERPEDAIPPIPLAILVNGSSASASEIVSASLQEAGRAIVVGTRSYGKGSVQTVISLDGDERGEAILKLTTARFFTAKGRPIQKDPDASEEDVWGVRPDVVVELDARRLLEAFRRQDALAAREAGGGTVKPEELPEDPQLDAAVHALTRRLLDGPPARKAGE